MKSLIDNLVIMSHDIVKQPITYQSVYQSVLLLKR